MKSRFLSVGALAVAVLFAGSLFAADISLPAPVTGTISATKIQVSTIVIDLDALNGAKGTEKAAAVSVPFRWVDDKGAITKTGVSKLTRAELAVLLGSDANSETARFSGLVETLVRSVVK